MQRFLQSWTFSLYYAQNKRCIKSHIAYTYILQIVLFINTLVPNVTFLYPVTILNNGGMGTFFRAHFLKKGHFVLLPPP